MNRKSLLLGSGRALVQAFGEMVTVNGESFLTIVHDISMEEMHLSCFTALYNTITECQKSSPVSCIRGL
jgi:hypothetical protein